MSKKIVSSFVMPLMSICFLLLPLSKVYGDDKQGFSFDGQLEVSLGRDDTVVVDEIDLTTSNSDTFFVLKAKGDIEYAFSSAHSASAGLSYTDQNYSGADNFDLQTLLYTLGYKFKYGNYTFNFDFREADADLGGNRFLVLTQISPSVSFFIGKQHFFRLAYTDIEKELVSRPARDANSEQYSLDYYFFWKGLRDYFISSVKFREEDALDPVFDFSGYQMRLAYKKRYSLFGLDSRLSIDAKYRRRDFDSAVNPNIEAFRLDKRRSFSVLNELELFDDFFWNIEVVRVSNSSNLSTVDFSETEIISGISYEF